MDITVLRTFLAIIDEGSFAAAARRMGISRSMCSKNIADLEQELGARLLVRTTRAVHTTPIGQVYADQLRDALARLDAANENVRAIAEKPTGMLKIGAPIAYTMKILQPHLLRFMEQYPDIQMQLQLDDGTSDVIGQGFDAVIRIGLLQDSSLIGRRIHHADLKIVASPGYVKEHGAPKSPEDLQQHKCLHYTILRRPDTWPLQRDGQTIYQKVVPVFSSNNSEMLLSMAANGKGIALLPDFLAKEELKSGTIVPLLSEFAVPGVPVSILYPPGKLLTAAMRTFLDFMARLRLE